MGFLSSVFNKVFDDILGFDPAPQAPQMPAPPTSLEMPDLAASVLFGGGRKKKTLSETKRPTKKQQTIPELILQASGIGVGDDGETRENSIGI